MLTLSLSAQSNSLNYSIDDIDRNILRSVEKVKDKEKETSYIVHLDEDDNILSSSFAFAVKNNVLYDFIIAPNLELEFAFKNWSFNLEYLTPWYVDTPGRFCYQILLGQAEVRYWLPATKKYWIGSGKLKDWILSFQTISYKPLTGFFFGGFYGMGIYDIQNSDEGTQGDIHVLFGLSGGYSREVSKHFNVEFSFGLGYFQSKNVNYYAYENLLIRKNNSSFQYLGPLKAKISLVWFVF